MVATMIYVCILKAHKIIKMKLYNRSDGRHSRRANYTIFVWESAFLKTKEMISLFPFIYDFCSLFFNSMLHKILCYIILVIKIAFFYGIAMSWFIFPSSATNYIYET